MTMGSPDRQQRAIPRVPVLPGKGGRMGSATRERRTPRRMLSILATLGLMAGVFTITASSASATACLATDGVASSSNLQTIIDGALTGDTIRVKGTCVGNFAFPGGGTAASLTLWGKGQPKATLDGNQSGTVVAVSTSTTVTLKNVLVTNGNTAFSGGGICNSGTVNLIGNTQVNAQHGQLRRRRDLQRRQRQRDGHGPGERKHGHHGLRLYRRRDLQRRNRHPERQRPGERQLSHRVRPRWRHLQQPRNREAEGQCSGERKRRAFRGGGIYNNYGKVTAAGSWTGTVSGNAPDNCEPDNFITGC